MYKSARAPSFLHCVPITISDTKTRMRVFPHPVFPIPAMCAHYRQGRTPCPFLYYVPITISDTETRML